VSEQYIDSIKHGATIKVVSCLTVNFRRNLNAILLQVQWPTSNFSKNCGCVIFVSIWCKGWKYVLRITGKNVQCTQTSLQRIQKIMSVKEIHIFLLRTN